jgi:hypothetical protein
LCCWSNINASLVSRILRFDSLELWMIPFVRLTLFYEITAIN